MRGSGFDTGLENPFFFKAGPRDRALRGQAVDTARRSRDIPAAQVAQWAHGAAAKAHGGCHSILAHERTASFGYNNLVSDMRSLAIMRETACSVAFDRVTKRNGFIGTSS